jgi:hypothetical protein
MRYLAVCLTLLLSVCAVPTFAAQSPTATVTGIVSDPQGAVIRGATVTAVQTETNVSRTATSNGEGAFALSALPPGSYTITVEASGFNQTKYESVTLYVGQTLTLDTTLQVGALTETIDENFAQEELIDLTTSGVDEVIKTREIQSLPLNGRNYLELAFLVPGNAPAPNFDPMKTNSITISSSGQLGRGGSVTVDGADNNDDVVGGPLVNIPQDAVQEFQVATNRFSAELGRSGSSVVNVVTKAGTNDYHGNVGFFFRNDALQALPATFDRGASEAPPFDREQIAVSVGGPIVRDRAWWFGAFEYRNQDGAVLVGERDVATRSLVRGCAPAPLDEVLATLRADVWLDDENRLEFHYSFENADDTTASTLIRPIGTASQRQSSENDYQSFIARWSSTLSDSAVNDLTFSYNHFFNETFPVATGPQLTFPSLQAGSSFRVPQATRQDRFEVRDTLSLVRGNHLLKLGGSVQRIDARFDLGVFREGRIELAEDFPAFDRNGDGVTNDDDLLIAVTLRSGKPDSDLVIPDADNVYVAGFIQDDWRIHPQFTLNLGLRYEVDSDVKNVSRYDEINPIVAGFLRGDRGRDANNFAPRIGFNWSTEDGRTSVHGGYGIYYDRVVLQIQSLERGLDGRALPIEVRAGNVFFIDPNTGGFPPFAPTLSNPFTGFILPGAGASGINIIDDDLQNPAVQQFNLGVQRQFFDDLAVRVDYIHDYGTHFIIGRAIGAVFNPVVGGPDRVVNLESSVVTKYDALFVSVEKRYADHYQLRASYTLSKAFNYANDDQIPFGDGPVNPDNLRLEYGPTPNDQRHRFSLSGLWELPYEFRLSGIWSLALACRWTSSVPTASRAFPTSSETRAGASSRPERS